MPKGFSGWAIFAVAQAALTFVFKLLYKLLEDAVIGWADDQLAVALGVTSPHWKTVFIFAQTWAPPVMLATIILVSYHWWHSKRSRSIEEREHGAGSKFPNVRLADNEALKNMLGNDERKKLIGLLQSGDLTAWAYVRGKADLMPLENRLWILYELELANIDGKPQTLFRHPSECKSQRPWGVKARVKPAPELTRIYDVHLNKAQLRLNWPEVFSA